MSNEKITQVYIADLDWGMFSVGDKVKLVGQVVSYDGQQIIVNLPEVDEELPMEVDSMAFPELGDQLNDWGDGSFEIVAEVNVVQDGLNLISITEYEE